MTNPKLQPMDPGDIDELREVDSWHDGDWSQAKSLISAHDYWQARSARLEQERDEARRELCVERGSRVLMNRREVASELGWGYLYPEEPSSGEAQVCEHDWRARRDNTSVCRKCQAVHVGPLYPESEGGQ